MRVGIALGPARRTAAAIELAVGAGAPAEPLRGAVQPRLVESAGHTVVLARPGDLLTLCGRDALDVAVLGSEVLLERGPEVVELLERDVGRARLVAATLRARGEQRRDGAPGGAAARGPGPGEAATLAATPGADEVPRRPLVATAHPWLARRYLEARGYQPRLIELVDEPWLAGRLLPVDLVVGLLDDGDEPEAPFVVRGEIVAGGLRVVAGLAAHALRSDELVAFARRAGEVTVP